MIKPLVRVAAGVLFLADAGTIRAGEAWSPDTLPRIAINDNREPAGTLEGGVLVLKLRAAVGVWRPEGEDGPALEVEAFGDPSGLLQAPAPLIRVPEGTEIAVTLRNDLNRPLRVHGLCARDGSPCAPVDLPAASTRNVRFTAGRAGTYHYWGTTSMPVPFRAASDTQLSGAFIVDPASGPASEDRVLVITDWTSLTRDQLLSLARADDPGVAFFGLNPRFTFLINGLSWPSTERLTYRIREEVRWRVINLSSQVHPMHLHGFYFLVDSLGDGIRDSPFDGDRKPRVVTQVLNPNATMSMTWVPEREGNWVFHCHVSEHIAPERRLTAQPQGHAGHHGPHAMATGMAGLVLGVTVHGDAGAETDSPARNAQPTRKLTLTMAADPGNKGEHPAYGFALTSSTDAPRTGADPLKIEGPGPTIVLRRGEPVEIALVNRLAEATAIHWHGIELDSYYDGVHGWSGIGSQVTPLIESGATFTVRITPPRTGTFIYHTHLHGGTQLTAGMYGALLVLDPGETFNPLVDHVFVIGRSGPGREAPVVLNGGQNQLFAWKAGERHRLRFINITPDDVLVASLATAEKPVEWRPLTKDGAPVPPQDATARPATQTIAVGETFDFEYEAPPGRQGLWINVRTPAGRWAVQARVVSK